MPVLRDREWMYKRLIRDGYLHADYLLKVDEFLDIAFSNERHVEKKSLRGTIVRSIKCPCISCDTTYYRVRDVVKVHLIKKGFMHDYTIWWAHCEKDSLIYVGQCSNPIENDDEDVDGCRQMVLDNIYPTFQPNLGSNTFEGQVPNATANRFYKLLKDSRKPLWNGCEDWSNLQAARRLLHLKSECNILESTFNKIVSTFKSMLLKDNTLPENFYQTKKSLKELTLS